MHSEDAANAAPITSDAIAVDANEFADATESPVTFASFGLRAELMAGVTRAGFTVPTRIQALAIPAVLTGKDVIARAQTGTGKTAAYGLPCLDGIERGQGSQLLVLVPTRELAEQVANELRKFGQSLGIRVATAVGGESMHRQLPLLTRGAEAVVATPGRLRDYLDSGRLSNFAPATLVLDEADEMLAMGFVDEVRAIAEYLPKPRRTLLFSATMPAAVSKLARDLTREPLYVKDDAEATPAMIEHVFFVVSERDRFEALIRLIEFSEPKKAIVFCRTRRDAGDLAAELSTRGIRARALHGEMTQEERRDVTEALKVGRLSLLVATDVAARGLDVHGLTHVINFGFPGDIETYVHRVGRTGRAGATGIALTLVHPADYGKLRRIEAVTGARIAPSEVPTRRQLQDRAAQRLAASILETPASDAARALAAKLIAATDDGDELIARLAEHLLKGSDAGVGDDRPLGFSMKELTRLNQRTHTRPTRFGGHAQPQGRPRHGHGGHGSRVSPGPRRPNRDGGAPR